MPCKKIVFNVHIVIISLYHASSEIMLLVPISGPLNPRCKINITFDEILNGLLMRF